MWRNQIFSLHNRRYQIYYRAKTVITLFSPLSDDSVGSERTRETAIKFLASMRENLWHAHEISCRVGENWRTRCSLLYILACFFAIFYCQRNANFTIEEIYILAYFTFWTRSTRKNFFISPKWIILTNPSYSFFVSFYCHLTKDRFMW